MCFVCYKKWLANNAELFLLFHQSVQVFQFFSKSIAQSTHVNFSFPNASSPFYKMDTFVSTCYWTRFILNHVVVRAQNKNCRYLLLMNVSWAFNLRCSPCPQSDGLKLNYWTKFITYIYTKKNRNFFFFVLRAFLVSVGRLGCQQNRYSPGGVEFACLRRLQ